MVEPHATFPNTEHKELNRDMHRRDIELPICKKSMIEQALPNLPQFFRDKLDPECTKSRMERLAWPAGLICCLSMRTDVKIERPLPHRAYPRSEHIDANATKSQTDTALEQRM
jgi:hypothetical protein